MASEVDVTSWGDLRSHSVADRMFLVASDLALVDVALAVANDQSAEVQAWVSSGQLVRPSADQVQVFESREGLAFRCVIISPFVLIQELLKTEIQKEEGGKG
jgi:hypothetical protein